jgi:hypothetical protein
MSTILFLHGWQSVPGGVKPTFLKDHGHTVINPALDDEDFDAAVRTAQEAFDTHRPEVVIGSSRGGAVAMNIKSGNTPLLLLCPAWKRWGSAKTVKRQTIILHSRADEVIPFSDSEELLNNSGLPVDALIQAGVDHRLADAVALLAIMWACQLLLSGEALPWLANQSQLPTVSSGDGETTFYERLKSEIVPWITQSTISFFHFRKDPATNDYGIHGKDRTGVFLRIGTDHFVLTASHGIEEAVANGTRLTMSWDDDENFFVPLTTDQIATSDPETIDVAAIKLSDTAAKALLKRHKPISLIDTARDSLNADGLFLIVGYPRAGTEFPQQNPLEPLKEPLLETLKYLGKRSATRWVGKGLTYSPWLHIVLGMPRDSYRASVGTGELLPIHEEVQGISGCGIWFVADRRQRKPLASIELSDCKLIAIEHTYDQDAGLVAGTWIDAAIMLIAMKFPETRAAIDLVYPTRTN